MEKENSNHTQEELLIKIRELEKEIKKLNNQIIKDDRYGLNWIDCPEAFEKDTEDKIPILEEVKDKAISNDDGKPTHILIEGDNYHALTCLNYTHKGKIDVIYIDPPYNTGSDGFTYKDKRFLKEYPNGSMIKREHPLRHSSWLSFMNKRLKLAKELLSDNGVIFISIDDNEVAQLKLLCDDIFNKEIVNLIAVKSSETSGVKMSHTSKKLPKIKEYILIYSNNEVVFNPLKISKVDDLEKFKGYLKYYSNIIVNKEDVPEDWIIVPLTQYISDNNLEFTEVEYLEFKIQNANRIVYRTNNNSFKGLSFETKTAKIISATGIEYIWWEGKQMLFLEDYIDENLCDLWTDISTINLNKEICDLPTFKNGQKPLELIQRIMKLIAKKSYIILDFFAGSGTTMHATMSLNEKDNGNRQCILVQQNENNICEEVCYERNKRVIKGYTNSKGEFIEGLGNSLKYYKTSFVGKHSPKKATDDDRVELSHKAGYLLALGENTLEEIKKTDYYQIFENKDKATAIYFKEDLSGFDDFVKEVESLKKPISVYIFSWDNAQVFEYNFEHIKQVQIKSIPQAILEIYKSINQ